MQDFKFTKVRRYSLKVVQYWALTIVAFLIVIGYVALFVQSVYEKLKSLLIALCVLFLCVNVYAATGGTITTDGSYTVHTFTSSGTFSCNNNLSIDVLVVAGGGGGGGCRGSGYGCPGGGGAGGMLYRQNFAVGAGSHTVTIGSGGNGGNGLGGSAGCGSAGSNSVFESLTAIGGGGGGNSDGTSTLAGGSGGSGGGGGAYNSAGGSGTSGQGNSGGSTDTANNNGGSSGGGAGAAGAYNSASGSNGGVGVQCNITGTNLYYAGGGGSGYYFATSPVGAGGLGGGGSGGGKQLNGQNGTANTGGGGGGGGGNGGTLGGAGGSGVIIIRYLTTDEATTTTSTSTTSTTTTSTTTTTIPTTTTTSTSTTSTTTTSTTTTTVPETHNGNFGFQLSFRDAVSVMGNNQGSKIINHYYNDSTYTVEVKANDNSLIKAYNGTFSGGGNTQKKTASVSTIWGTSDDIQVVSDGSGGLIQTFISVPDGLSTLSSTNNADYKSEVALYQSGNELKSLENTGQRLVWREYFNTASVDDFVNVCPLNNGIPTYYSSGTLQLALSRAYGLREYVLTNCGYNMGTILVYTNPAAGQVICTPSQGHGNWIYIFTCPHWESSMMIGSDGTIDCYNNDFGVEKIFHFDTQQAAYSNAVQFRNYLLEICGLSGISAVINDSPAPSYHIIANNTYIFTWDLDSYGNTTTTTTSTTSTTTTSTSTTSTSTTSTTSTSTTTTTIPDSSTSTTNVSTTTSTTYRTTSTVTMPSTSTTSTWTLPVNSTTTTTLPGKVGGTATSNSEGILIDIREYLEHYLSAIYDKINGFFDYSNMATEITNLIDMIKGTTDEENVEDIKDAVEPPEESWLHDMVQKFADHPFVQALQNAHIDIENADCEVTFQAYNRTYSFNFCDYQDILNYCGVVFLFCAYLFSIFIIVKK